tara:strand:+ start:455 stop:958 length:504 start_codon:yes stop_codon:yes gene_type:complete
MIQKIQRNYLEINSLHELVETNNPSNEFVVNLLYPANYQLNKFFYKNVGRKHNWVDRLSWSEKEWIKYTTDNDVNTYVLMKNSDLVGYFELILHKNKNEIEIAYLGLLEEYHNQKLGSFLLSSAIKKSFLKKPKRVWVHTCSLDHKNALKNYISRGMKVFKKETVSI